MTRDGERIGRPVRIDSEPFELAAQIASWGEAPEVVLEATYGWYWGCRRAHRRRRLAAPGALVALRSGLKAQVHSVLAKQGVLLPMSDIFGVDGRKAIDELRLDRPFQARPLANVGTRCGTV